MELYFEAAAEIAANAKDQAVVSSQEKIGDLLAYKVGTRDQPILAKKGDDLRIDWGYFYIAVREAALAQKRIERLAGPRGGAFAAHGSSFIDSGMAMSAGRAVELVGSMYFDLGTVRAQPVSRWLMLAYDDEYSIQYFKKNLRPYWRRNGDDAAALLKKAAAEYESLKKRCEKFDTELMAALTKAGGEKYAQDMRAGISPVLRGQQGWRLTTMASHSCSPRRTSATAASAPWT